MSPSTRTAFELDYILQEPSRLSIMMLCATAPRSFTQVRHTLAMNPGAISQQAQYLIDVGYLTRAIQATTGRMHRTTYFLTHDGEEALALYYRVSAKVTRQLRGILSRHS